jgi:GNAT superfamily N-acetyltransferase
MNDSDVEHEESGWLFDTANRRYRTLRCESLISCDWRVFHDKQQIGHACIIKDSLTLRLGDIVIYDAVIISRPRYTTFLQGLFKREPQRVAYRGQGIGSALLKMIITWANQKGIREIVGEISAVDLKPNPKLIDWYLRHGFTFEPYQAPGKLVGKVSLMI